ncbi:hypothetical protein [Corynebacterium nuruki]|jgi:hypothetical protein|uniref:hypothetical protein n=1 Tax=Corynebacterium nuruki TaxID=1032851 RepID=UPI000248540B|nr:hypothetical protein [Corynebacterium nuruki]MDN6439193.1 hypothetical protein [Corynebacterium nuruki]
MARLIAGGLCGIAVILALLGSPLWVAHAVAGVVAVVAVFLSERSGWWLVVPYVALVAVIAVAWF